MDMNDRSKCGPRPRSSLTAWWRPQSSQRIRQLTEWISGNPVTSSGRDTGPTLSRNPGLAIGTTVSVPIGNTLSPRGGSRP